MVVYGPAPPKGSKIINGRTIVPPKFQGPVKPGDDESVFRETGRTVSRGSGGSSRGGVQLGPTRETLEQARQQTEQARQQAELKKQQEEQRKLEQQLKKQREQKAFSGTVAGQLETNKNTGPQPLTVEVYNPEDRYTQTPYRQGFFTGVGQAFGNFFKDLGRQELRATSTYTARLKYSEGLKRDETAYFKPQVGTIQVNPVTGKPNTDKVTFGDLEKKDETGRFLYVAPKKQGLVSEANKLVSDTQGRVTRGEIDVVTGQKIVDTGLKDINERYTKIQEESYEKYPGVPGVFERTGKARKIASAAPDILAVGGIVAASAVNPVLGASLGVGYFTGKGVLQASSKPTTKEIRQQGGLFANVGKDDSGRLKILNPTELDVRYRQERKEAGMNLLFAASSGLSLVTASANAYSKAIFDTGMSSTEATLGFQKRYLRGTPRDGVKFDNVLYSQTKKGTADFQFVSTQENPLFAKADGSFILGTGKGRAEFRSLDFLKQIRRETNPYITGSEEFLSLGTGRVAPAIFQSSSKGVVLTNINSKLKAVSGSGIVSTSKGNQEFLFGGLVNTGKEASFSVGGKASAIKVGINRKTPIVNVLDDAALDVNFGTTVRSVSLKIPTRNYAIQQNIQSNVLTGGSDDAAKLFGFKGGGSKSSKQFLNNLYSQNLEVTNIPGFSESTSKIIQSSIVFPSRTVTSISAPSSIFAGTGQYETADLFPRGRGSGGILEGPVSVFDKPVRPAESGFAGGGSPSSKNPFANFDLTPAGSFDFGLKAGTSAGTSSRSKLISSTSEKSRSSFNILTGQSTKIIPKQDSIPRQDIISRTIQDQVLQQSLIQPVVQQPTLSPGIFGRGRPGGFDLPFPPIPKGSFTGRPTSRRSQRGRQRTQYQTSLTGSVLGITGSGIAPGGLSIRGILNGEEKKRKKKFSIL